MPQPSTVSQPAPLLEHLFTAWPEVKKKQIRTWLKFKAVTVNGQPISQFDHPLKAGDVVAIRGDRYAAPGDKLPSGLKLLHEDADILVIEKPERLLTIASEKVRDNTAYFYLTDYVRRGDPFSHERVWIVHRLDRDTSGLMVFAKTEAAKRTLQARWEDAKKCYYAVVTGALPEEKGTLKSYLDESDPGKVYVTPDREQGRLAITHYRVLKVQESYSLLRLTLETGRRHQIRVQLAEAGCPIIGDEKYSKSKFNPIRRLALHACLLEFPHPRTGERMKFESPLPGNFAGLVGGYVPPKKKPTPPPAAKKKAKPES